MQRIVALANRHTPEILAGYPVFVHVFVGDQGDPGTGNQHAVGHVPGPVDKVGADDIAGYPLPHALPGASVHGAIADHGVRLAGRHRHGCLGDGAHRRAAAVVDLAEECQVTRAHRTRHLDFIRGIQRIADKAVDLCGCEAGIVASGLHTLGSQRQFTDPGCLAEFGHTNSGDRRGVAHCNRHHAAPCSLNTGRRKPSGSSCMTISTARLKSTSSGLQSTSCEVMRVPSSRSTSTIISG